MRAIRRRDTKPEVLLRSLLHARGLRFRVDKRLILGENSARPDVLFGRGKVAVFVDGCFWHSCPEHGRVPNRNTHYWSTKLARNRERDARNTALLERHGWLVLRVWEHEAPEVAAERVAKAVESRR